MLENHRKEKRGKKERRKEGKMKPLTTSKDENTALQKTFILLSIVLVLSLLGTFLDTGSSTAGPGATKRSPKAAVE